MGHSGGYWLFQVALEDEKACCKILNARIAKGRIQIVESKVVTSSMFLDFCKVLGIRRGMSNSSLRQISLIFLLDECRYKHNLSLDC